MINGSISPDEQDAKQLFPHTHMCAQRMREGVVREGRALPCTCPARSGRKNFLYLIRRTRRSAYIDAYARIRHQARLRAERAGTPQERLAFEEVASWAEDLEFGKLEE